MRYLIDFLNTKKLDFKFDLETDDIKILKFLLKNYLDGIQGVKISTATKELFGKNDKYLDLKYIQNFKNLANLGFITIDNFTPNLNLTLLHQEAELSEYFFKILEGKEKNEIVLEKYEDEISYLKDSFYLIELFYKRSILNNKEAINKEISKTKDLIDKKIKMSKIYLRVEEIFKKYQLNEDEKIIFLAILKQEYLGEFEILRSEDTLLNLISENEIKKFQNQSYFLPNSKLIKNQLIEEGVSFDLVNKSFFLQEDILKDIISQKPNKKILIQNLAKESEIFEFIRPNIEIDDVIVSKEIRNFFNLILKRLDKNVIKKLNSWGIKNIDTKIIFYGPAGTGKTMSAIALAKSLKKDILSLDCSKILSKYIGESEQNVRKIFDEFNEIRKKSKKDPILLLNEADQFFSSRIDQASASGEKMHNQMQNIFLEQFEKFDALVIATTNLISNFDKAFSRRFNYKIEFFRPDFSQRFEIWKKNLPKNAPFEENFDIKKLANFDLSGAEINLVIKNTALKVAISDQDCFKTSDFIDEIKLELSSKFDSDKKVGLLW